MCLFDRIWLESGGQKARENEREVQSFRVRAAKAENAFFVCRARLSALAAFARPTKKHPIGVNLCF